MSSKVQNESRAERRRRRSAPDEARAPRTVPDIIDFIVASLLLVTAAFFARESLNPDGVGYLEIAEAITRGRWGEVLQGYWSPGCPALLASLVFIAGDDRPFLLLLAHVLQAAIGVCALWLVRVVVKRRVPDALHRVAAWVGAWVILRFLSQVLITPDLALCAALLGLLALQGSESRAAQIGAGLCAGAAFLLKTSIWPWGLVAIALTAWPSIRIKR